MAAEASGSEAKTTVLLVVAVVADTGAEAVAVTVALITVLGDMSSSVYWIHLYID